MRSSLFTLATCLKAATALQYDPAYTNWNLNMNENTANPMEYYTTYDNHTYHPSPENWRFPFYSFFVDKFANGDPTNDNINGTSWEQDPLQTQLRHGGDARGLRDSLDYIQGMGIKGLYLVGSIFHNVPWAADAFSPLDHTFLDRHFGTIQEWREVIDEIHARGMYVLLDNTMGTMGNLMAFENYLNTSAPWTFTEHNAQWKTPIHYSDWEFGNNYHEVCPWSYPRFYQQSGELYNDENTTRMVGCKDSEFNQYGDAGAFGQYPEWLKQTAKFDGVQDRLRDWRPSVQQKLQHFYCMLVTGLDVDGFRIDKALQVTVDGQVEFNRGLRQCARRLGKNNFFIPGEMVNGNSNVAVYMGRGKSPDQWVENVTEAITTNTTYLRDDDHFGVDANAFHYTTYRGLMRYLGLDGNLLAAYDAPVNFADAWRVMQMTNDFVNPNTGSYDPRHLHGASNQDVLRWPGLINGTERQLAGSFVVTLLMPGINMISWGEEQAMYVLDNTAGNYLYGRQAMTSSPAWKMHGCYKVGTINLSEFPVNSSSVGCQDDSVALDHRDTTSPVYNVYKMMNEMRRRYPVLNDGFVMRQLSNQTWNYTLPGSYGTPTETGLFSAYRGANPLLQDLTTQGGTGNQEVWLVYTNYNDTRTYQSDCGSTDGQSLLAPFPGNTTVRNLFPPYDQWTLQSSNTSLSINGSTEPNGCLPEMNMTRYGYKAFVPIDSWQAPSPMISKFILNDTYMGHDQRLLSVASGSSQDTVTMELRFTEQMDCDSVRNSLNISSTTEDGSTARIDTGSIDCLTTDPYDTPFFYSGLPSIWRYRTNITGISNGVHVVTVNNATSASGSTFTGSRDNIMFRIGKSDNPMVFPMTSNYTNYLLFPNNVEKRDSQTESGLYVHHRAPGADMWRYSLTWGAIWSDWMLYSGGNSTLAPQTWTGSKKQNWEGDHVKLQYWSRMTGSSSHVQEADVAGSEFPERRFPHLFLHGAWNQYGYDAGVPNEMEHTVNSTWTYDFLTEWPSQFQVNVWGMTEDGLPDVSAAYGDVDNDTVLDRISPVSLQPAVVNITDLPESPYLSWKIIINDGDLRYYLQGAGSRWRQLALFILLAVVPLALGFLGVLGYQRLFYQVKFNKTGLVNEKDSMAVAFKKHMSMSSFKEKPTASGITTTREIPAESSSDGSIVSPRHSIEPTMAANAILSSKRRTVLIATMEYDIADWNIKIKIGGLGVMAQLMGKHLAHEDIVWVVPCCGGIDYPRDTQGPSVTVTILGKQYEVQVQYHKLDNITYMLLDAPVFRQQTAKEPYPARMDDHESAIYYSAWNQCIAEATKRFNVDLYHINDYHGSIAPLYLLPETIPCCLSLHNAEFQGLWPMRTPEETQELCSVFNLPEKTVAKYVQFGEIFNLLHAGSSILRLHQKGFGAVGVSKKYGKRSWARYPIFWGLRNIGALPNPDPSDLSEWHKKYADPNQIVIDQEYERSRGSLKMQAQEWADLEQREDADLFVFVGRWSMQKGIDLIADVFPAILEKHPQTQLICIGPTIDLYGKFAALKLEAMMKKYPGRVYSKPEFTALPPFIFSGAEFALIPSRDEPFGLVAVEFGRKGALGVGSRVGGLGQMPGWWYTIESQTTKHQMAQFKTAIHSAIKSNKETRAMMRARSAKQRFPVAQWTEDLEILQAGAIRAHDKFMNKRNSKRVSGSHPGAATPGTTTGWSTPNFSNWSSPHIPGWMSPSSPSSGTSTPWGMQTPAIRSPAPSRPNSRPPSPTRNTTRDSGAPSVDGSPVASRRNSFSLGTRSGPGHVPYKLLHSALSHTKLSKRASAEDGTHKALTRIDDEVTISPAEAREAEQRSRLEQMRPISTDSLAGEQREAEASTGLSYMHKDLPPIPAIPAEYRPVLPQSPSMLSLQQVIDEKDNKEPQDLMPAFNDPTGLYFKSFSQKLESLNGKNSETSLCTEEFLERSEKQWFNRLHHARMSKMTSPANSVREVASDSSSAGSSDSDHESMSQFLLPSNYQPPSGVRRFLSKKTGDWPVYAWLLAFGQILAANSYQIVLLTGTVGQTANELYAIATVYFIFSCIWWYIFRRLPCLYVISGPWAFYGFAFLLLGIAPWTTSTARYWIQHVATGSYAAASASGSFFFAQNFGSTGSVPVRTWGFRACMIQGTQQIWIVILWFWGRTLTDVSTAGRPSSSLITYGWPLTAIAIPISLLLFAIGTVLYLGLPAYYRQQPGSIPSFYRSTLRRKIILWFFLVVLVQNYFLSSPYGRNWTFLWSSSHAPAWSVILLIFFFFVVLWALFLWFFAHLSATHSWFIPIFALALGSPRWAQMLWSTSGVASYLPWAGGPIASALIARGLWLWLGLLDSIQGVGLGMILLQTLARTHVTFTLVAAQALGSISTILARATAPNNTGPGNVFPDLAGRSDWTKGLEHYEFWLALVSQVAVVWVGFVWFRREQLSKP
ncbi:Cell wall alpha-1,3-glucan synthase ags1 [Elsinoe australis]|uniref:alpha-1,3-glucan synthase n=1 Tax=Elsinoe australis TaxID=40998 RepID=A0A2P7YJB7_9PEZI|nr:Cell wall alpha-1,3-glucan synthase ags1 [Elsinoe australis]